MASATHRGPEPHRDDAELLETIRAHSHESEERQAAFQVLVVRYQWLVQACVQPYRGAPETHEDLMQAGYLGLAKAITYSSGPGLEVVEVNINVGDLYMPDDNAEDQNAPSRVS